MSKKSKSGGAAVATTPAEVRPKDPPGPPPDLPAGRRPILEAEIPVAQLVPTEYNTRRFRENKAFEELCASIRSIGRIFTPLIARPMPASWTHARGDVQVYDLLAGRRRFEAATRIGLTTVPVHVYELDDVEAMEFVLAENLTREDLTPFEAAEAVQHLLNLGWDEATIAGKFGKSADWVAKRAKLANLCPKWRHAIDDPKCLLRDWADRIDLLEQIARLSHASQELLLTEELLDTGRLDGEDGYYGGTPTQAGLLPTVAELRRHIETTVLKSLASAAFAMDDATLLPEVGPCTECPKRTSQQPVLFADLDTDQVAAKKAKTDRCLDMACFTRKAEIIARRRISELQLQHGKCVRVTAVRKCEIDPAALKSLTKAWDGEVSEVGTYDSKWQEAHPNDKDAVPAVVVVGNTPHQIGTTTWVKPKHAGSYVPPRSSKPAPKANPAGGMSMAEKRKVLESRRRAWIINAVRDRLEKMARKPETLPREIREDQALSLAVAFGTSHRHDSLFGSKGGWKEFDRLVKIDGIDELVAAIIPVLCSRLTVHQVTKCEKQWAEAERCAQLFEIDLVELRTKAEAEIPTPKSWGEASPAKPPAAAASKAKPSKKPKAKAKRRAG